MALLLAAVQAAPVADHKAVNNLVAAQALTGAVCFEKTALYMMGMSCEGTAQGTNFGTYDTTDECGEAAFAAGCATIMFSTSYPTWGCRCCDSPANAGSHSLWSLYSVESGACMPPPPPLPPPAPCTPVEVKLTTVAWANEITWSIDKTIYSTGTYNNGAVYTQEVCLPEGVHTMYCDDSYGDGWHGGFITIDGQTLCSGFNQGHEYEGTFVISAAATPTAAPTAFGTASSTTYGTAGMVDGTAASGYGGYNHAIKMRTTAHIDAKPKEDMSLKEDVTTEKYRLKKEAAKKVEAEEAAEKAAKEAANKAANKL